MSDTAYDGLDAIALTRRLRLPRVVLRHVTTSTMDDAHALAANAAVAGTLVLANAQTAGRGRSGGSWVGVDGESILCTMIERPASPDMLAVLSIRVGLATAKALDGFADAPIQLKWPNDLFIGGGKAAGILIEARWRDGRPDWVAIALGLNVGRPPAATPTARGLRAGISRLEVLDAIIPAMRSAATLTGALDEAEMLAWSERDFLAGRRVSEPVQGVIRGIVPTGELKIETVNGMALLRSGTVKLVEDS